MFGSAAQRPRAVLKARHGAQVTWAVLKHMADRGTRQALHGLDLSGKRYDEAVAAWPPAQVLPGCGRTATSSPYTT
jgi:hypothetical protein